MIYKYPNSRHAKQHFFLHKQCLSQMYCTPKKFLNLDKSKYPTKLRKIYPRGVSKIRRIDIYRGLVPRLPMTCGSDSTLGLQLEQGLVSCSGKGKGKCKGNRKGKCQTRGSLSIRPNSQTSHKLLSGLVWQQVIQQEFNYPPYIK